MLARFSALSILALSLSTAALTGCSGPAPEEDIGASQEDALRGPGNNATDARRPKLGADLHVLEASKISLADGVAQVAKANGPVIEAKFELDDEHKLALSLYPVPKGLGPDSERNVFQELAGNPAVAPFKGSLSTFEDQEHVLRSSRDLTLVQLSRLGVEEVARRSYRMGKVFWVIPTIKNHRAGYGVYAMTWKGNQTYRFVDGEGSDASTTDCPFGLEEIGSGPGAKATDARTPKLGANLAVVRTSKVTMAAALAAMEAAHGPAIEAKFELDDAHKLSLSIYPVGKGASVDAERNTFFELAGDPTAASYAPAKSEFKMPDFEHVARSARDLTLVQTASLTLRQAVDDVDDAVPGGFVYWAIPTIRDTRAGYGVYTLGKDGKAHYFFVS